MYLAQLSPCCNGFYGLLLSRCEGRRGSVAVRQQKRWALRSWTGILSDPGRAINSLHSHNDNSRNARPRGLVIWVRMLKKRLREGTSTVQTEMRDLFEDLGYLFDKRT